VPGFHGDVRLREGGGCATIAADMVLRGAGALLALSLAAAGRTAGAENPCGVEQGAYVHGPRSAHAVALTFDLCPTSSHPGFSRCVYDELVEGHIPATFFVTGSWARSHREDLSELAAVPFFEVGMHGLTHLALADEPAAVIRDQIKGDRRCLRGLGVHPVALFRPPYGSTKEEVAEVARRLGVRVVLWDVVSGDADPHVKSAAMEREVLRRTHGGSIVIMHANHAGSAVEEALPHVIGALRAKGLSFVTVRELLDTCGGRGGT
jgi:peptidoglycan/xylan/chitin deacetylase (PgdA/CDA1 family)